jgi:hypothetical protein
MRVRLTMESRNGKVGPIPVSTTEASSCANSCPLIGKCYAASGPVAIVWRQVTEGTHGTDWRSFTAQIAALPEGQAWRHNQAGDLPGAGDTIDPAKLKALVTANTGRMGFTYTHKPMNSARNRKAISDANSRGFTINLSADTLAEADSLASLEIGPVVVLLDAKDGERADTVTPEGRKVITCPATYRDDISCGGGTVRVKGGTKETKACLLCARANRKTVVGFPAHGAFKKLAAAVARGEVV